MGTLPAGGARRLTLSLRPGTAGAWLYFTTENAAPAFSLSGELRHAR
jgi:hypothetical protein